MTTDRHPVPAEILSRGWLPGDREIAVNDQWTLYSFIEFEDDDCRKLGHYLYNSSTGEIVNVDWSPYEHLTAEDARRWLALGKPRRIGIGPLNRADLDRIESGK